MTYRTPQLTELGAVHELTLANGDDGEHCGQQASAKCQGAGDGHSTEAGFS
ncbi:MAG: hypothetical protein QOJ49_233 [Actinomycetota bacterium]|jgi:hypothetical protein|nr:hypothetical protein [Actinomycetota bacterium]MDQ1641018.1 hypothetical protein [Actinomycetota bacterium]